MAHLKKSGSEFGLGLTQQSHAERSYNARLSHTNITFASERDLAEYAATLSNFADRATNAKVDPDQASKYLKVVNASGTYSESLTDHDTSYKRAFGNVVHQCSILSQLCGHVKQVCSGARANERADGVTQAMNALAGATSAQQRCSARAQAFSAAGINIEALEQNAINFTKTQLVCVSEEQAKSIITKSLPVMPAEFAHTNIVSATATKNKTDMLVGRMAFDAAVFAKCAPPVSVTSSNHGILVHFTALGTLNRPGSADILVGPLACALRVCGGAGAAAWTVCTHALLGLHAGTALGRQLGCTVANGYSPGCIRAKFGKLLGLQDGEYASDNNDDLSVGVRAVLACSPITLCSGLLASDASVTAQGSAIRLLADKIPGPESIRSRVAMRIHKNASALPSLCRSRAAMSLWTLGDTVNESTSMQIAKLAGKPLHGANEIGSAAYNEALQCDVFATAVRKPAQQLWSKLMLVQFCMGCTQSTAKLPEKLQLPTHELTNPNFWHRLSLYAQERAPHWWQPKPN